MCFFALFFRHIFLMCILFHVYVPYLVVLLRGRACATLLLSDGVSPLRIMLECFYQDYETNFSDLFRWLFSGKNAKFFMLVKSAFFLCILHLNCIRKCALFHYYRSRVFVCNFIYYIFYIVSKHIYYSISVCLEKYRISQQKCSNPVYIHTRSRNCFIYAFKILWKNKYNKNYMILQQ